MAAHFLMRIHFLSGHFLFDLSVFKLRFLDVLDILAIAFILRWIYNTLRGSLALRILMGVVLLYTVWFIVKTLRMDLLTLLLNQFTSLGVIIFAIVFQPELRRFLVLLGNQTMRGQLGAFFQVASPKEGLQSEIQEIVKALKDAAQTQTGILIVLTKNANLEQYLETGVILDALVNHQLIYSIFLRDSPLHDGAIIINTKRMLAAKCILPLSDSQNLPPEAGLRHRAALGISEVTHAIAVVVSEETGKMSYALEGVLTTDVDTAHLTQTLSDFFNT